MKKYLTLTIILYLSHMCFAQWKIMPFISVCQSFEMLGNYQLKSNPYGTSSGSYRSDNSFYSSQLKLGVKFKKEKFSFVLYGSNQLLIKRVNRMFVLKDKKYMNSDLLGIGFIFHFLENKRIKPFIEFNGASELTSNYQNKILYQKNFYPFELYLVNEEYPLVDKGNVYQSTPFLGNILLGVDINLVRDFSFNASFGYGLRVLRTNYGILTFAPNISTSLPTKVEYIGSPYNLNFHMLTFQLGLSYAFSFKKKSKMETP